MRKSALTQRKKLKRLAEVTASTGTGPPRQEYVLAVSNPQHREPPVIVSHAALERAVGFVAEWTSYGKGYNRLARTQVSRRSGAWTIVKLGNLTVVHPPTNPMALFRIA